MRNLSAGQKTSFTSDVLTICSLLEIYVNDGSVVYLTDHDQNIGDYNAEYGLDLSAILMQLGGTGETATASVLPDRGAGGGLTFPMVEGGLLDSALVKCYWTDYTKMPLDPIQIFQGYVSEVVYGNSAVITLTLNSLLSVPRSLCADVMSQTCRADFGDAKCKVDAAALVDGPHVFAPIDAQSFVMTRDEVTPPSFYNNGTLYFQTGANKGLGYEILTVSNADANGRETIYTKVPLAFDVVLGDYFFLYPGCDKVITSGCTYWNNTVNFQGEPFIADQSDILPPVSDLTVKSTGIETGMPAICNWWLTQYIKIGFGKTLLFAPGTRAADDSTTTKVPGFGYIFFSDYVIPQDAYTAIFNLLGALDTIVAYDGSLTPIDPTAQAALTAAGFAIPLNLNISSVLIIDSTSTLTVEATYLYVFFNVGTKGIQAAYDGLGLNGYGFPEPGQAGNSNVIAGGNFG